MTSGSDCNAHERVAVAAQMWEGNGLGAGAYVGGSSPGESGISWSAPRLWAPSSTQRTSNRRFRLSQLVSTQTL